MTDLPRTLRSFERLHFEWTLRIQFFFQKRGVKFLMPSIGRTWNLQWEKLCDIVVWLSLVLTPNPFWEKLWACLVHKGFCTQFWKRMQKWEMFAFELCVNHLWIPSPLWTPYKPPLNWWWAVLDDWIEPHIAVLTNKLEVIRFWFY